MNNNNTRPSPGHHRVRQALEDQLPASKMAGILNEAIDIARNEQDVQAILSCLRLYVEYVAGKPLAPSDNEAGTTPIVLQLIQQKAQIPTSMPVIEVAPPPQPIESDD